MQRKRRELVTLFRDGHLTRRVCGKHDHLYVGNTKGLAICWQCDRSVELPSNIQVFCDASQSHKSDRRSRVEPP